MFQIIFNNNMLNIRMCIVCACTLSNRTLKIQLQISSFVINIFELFSFPSFLLYSFPIVGPTYVTKWHETFWWLTPCQILKLITSQIPWIIHIGPAINRSLLYACNSCITLWHLCCMIKDFFLENYRSYNLSFRESSDFIRQAVIKIKLAQLLV
jgi:hypothetical protein